MSPSAPTGAGVSAPTGKESLRGARLASGLRVIAAARLALLIVLFAALFLYFSLNAPNFLGAYNIYSVVQNGVIIFVYAMTGMLVGLAAVIQLGQSGTVQPNAGLGLELQVIAATVIGGTSILGGKGTVVGAVLGALLVEAVHNALITIGNLGLIEGLIIGVLILIAVGFDVIQNRRAASG